LLAQWRRQSAAPIPPPICCKWHTETPRVPTPDVGVALDAAPAPGRLGRQSHGDDPSAGLGTFGNSMGCAPACFSSIETDASFIPMSPNIR
jgi:hypothetical protein